jgi:FtsH-binding integral membrane protein
LKQQISPAAHGALAHQIGGNVVPLLLDALVVLLDDVVELLEEELQTFAVQVWPTGHVPQSRTVPQPSGASPQLKFCWAQLIGVQTMLQTFAMAAPQTWPGGQVPQLRAPPHPSLAVPQLKPSAAQVVGAQLQTFATQVWAPGHVPQRRRSPQPSLAVPQLKPCCAQLLNVVQGPPSGTEPPLLLLLLVAWMPLLLLAAPVPLLTLAVPPWPPWPLLVWAVLLCVDDAALAPPLAPVPPGPKEIPLFDPHAVSDATSAEHATKLAKRIRSRVSVHREACKPTTRDEHHLERRRHAGQRTLVAPRDSASDALWVTYRWMTLGLATTGVVALAVAHSPVALSLLLGNRMVFYVPLFGQLGLVMALSAVATRVGTAFATLMFFAYAALTGVTFSVLFLVYTASSIAATFFVTAGAFAGLSFFGLVTKHDLSPIGRFGVFALFGVIIVSVVNLFPRSNGLDWLITLLGVLLFAGLTAYDAQRLKDLFRRGETHANLPLVGALRLYLDFINMFLFLLRILGGRRRD